MRLFMIIGLGMTLAVTSACQKSGKHRAKFKTGTQAEEKASARAEAINNMIGDSSKCLRVDKLIAAMMTTPDETYMLYTSDTNVIEKADQEPFLEILTGKNLIDGSTRAFYLKLEGLDDKCETVSLPNTGGPRAAVFKVLKTSNKNKLNLQNANDPEDLISYEYNRKNHLKITTFTSSLACGKKIRVQRTWTLAYGEGLERLNVSREMMNLFDRNIQLPTEARRATFDTGKTNQTRVHLSYPTYSIIAGSVKEASKQNALCPK